MEEEIRKINLSLVVEPFALSEVQKGFFEPVVLLLGDRLTCCDEAFGAFADGQLVGVITLSWKGQGYDNKPEIVGLYVNKEFRNRGIGRMLAEMALRRFEQKGMRKVVVQTLSAGSKHIFTTLPPGLQQMVDLQDFGNILDGPGLLG